MTENNDPWANLADTLGAAPGGEPPQQPQRRPAKPSKPAEAEKPVNEAPAAETSQTDWGGVADQLGIQSSASAAPEPTKKKTPREAHRAPQPPQAERLPVDDGFGAGLLDDGGVAPPRSSRPPRRSNDRPRRSSRPARSDDNERQATPSRNDRSQESSDQTRDQTRDHERDQATDESGEPRRRRRGRRGGRGRGRRNDRSTQEEARADDNEELPGYGRNLDGERTERQGSAAETSSDVRPQTPREDGFGQRLNTDSEERTAEADAGPRSGSSRDDDQEGSQTDDRPPRRRRRRRGRGRGRRTRDGETIENEGQRSHEESGEESNEVQGDQQTGEKPFTEREPRGNEDSDGEPRRRRRRRRRTSDEEAQETSAEGRPARRPASGSSSGQRRPARNGGRRGESGRGGGGEGRRRETFSRVGSRREDDEEGLEFLGTEDDMAPSDHRDNGDEDVLSESGLDGVRDVPSWVEAIGIVIASNMDSRKQPPQS